MIVGCDGQDGRLLHELLAGRGYDLVGIARGNKAVDIAAAEQVFDLVRRFKPHEIYYLAAFHHSSEDRPIDPIELFRRSQQVHVLSLVNFLEAIRRFSKSTRLFYAASSHVFGAPKSSRQDESTPLAPNNVYGLTKAAGLMTCRHYRAQHGLFVSVGILYNHESALRGPAFVSQKIVQGALAVKAGRQKRLVLGDLSAEVDWGYAPDYVEAMRRILRHVRPDDFVVSTGIKHTVRDFAKAACARLGLDWRACVRENPRVLTKKKAVLVGNSAKLQRATGWKPSVDFAGLVDAMLAKRPR